MYEIDEQQIRLWWRVFKGSGKLVEVRLLGKTTYSGYFTDIETLITQLRPLLDHNSCQYYGAMQAYFTLNDINDALYSREQRNQFVKKPKSTTTDGDITHRTFVLIDLDPKRAAGISASNEEYEKSHLKCVAVFRYLMEQGFKEPIITCSGNGYHCYVPCDMPNDDEHNELVKRFLQSLSKMFSDEFVEIDEKVFNPARIDKLVGTWAKKGADSSDRPWRISRILKIPQDLSHNDDSLFKKIADLLPKEEPKPLPNRGHQQYNNAQPFNLVTWLNEHGIRYREKKSGSSTFYELEQCPWVDSHSDHKKWDSALFQDTDGKITFNCTHSHCKDRTWHDFRMFYEPDAYERKYQPPQSYTPRQYTTSKPKYEIKEEVSELGVKWLSLSQIRNINLSQIEKVRTGFTELDRKIKGLHMSEISILSGSNSSGKSSWLNSLILNIIEQNEKVALWSGELRADILKTWIQMVAAGKKFLLASNKYDGFYVPDNVSAAIDEWLEGKLFIYNNEYGCKWEQIFNDMKEMLNRGVRVFILDNLFTLDIDIFDGDKNNKQKDLVLQIKDFAKKESTHIILVAHPRKVMTFLRKNDISGTGDIQNAADNIFIMHRVNRDFIKAGSEFFTPDTIEKYQNFGNVIEVAKNRMYGIVDYLVGLHYEIESRRFLNEMSENKVYGWYKQPVQQTLQMPANDHFDNDDSDDWLTPRNEEPPF